MADFAKLMVDLPQIAEADLNPVRIFNNGTRAAVLDARMFLKKAEGD